MRVCVCGEVRLDGHGGTLWVGWGRELGRGGKANIQLTDTAHEAIKSMPTNANTRPNRISSSSDIRYVLLIYSSRKTQKNNEVTEK